MEKAAPLKILVSHPGKQHVHHLLKALQVYNIDYVFYTSFWYKPENFPFNLINFLPNKIRLKLQNELKKRYDKEINSNKVFQLAYFEIVREVIDKFAGDKLKEIILYYRNIIHDKWVASQLKKVNPTIVIGYEECCLLTFKKAKELGITTLLDLAQIHYKEIEHISNSFPFFKKKFANISLRAKINSLKENELKKSDYIICLSSFAEKSLLNNGFNKNKIFIANLGADTSKFQQKKEYNTDAVLKLIYVGTLLRRKGIDILLQAVKQLNKNIHLYLIGPVGDSDLENELQNYKQLFTRVNFAHHEELNNYFNKSDVFVLPSYLDSWGMVTIEAMTCGLPVIVTENTGSKDAVDNASGIIIPAGDIEALKKAIMLFYDSRHLLKSMGTSAVIKAKEFEWKNYYEQVNNIVKQITIKQIEN